MALPPGTRLGPYEIAAALGSGGMGDVYKGSDTRLNRQVAIKVLPAEFAADPERRQRFEREARLIAALNHPHICAVHDVGTATVGGKSLSYLVMELLDGETLEQRLSRGALPLPETLRIGAGIAQALAAAHRQSIVHRDLKPANVMLVRSQVKLLDFGIAKSVVPQASGAPATTVSLATAPGIGPGTLPYMSPEQLEGRTVDPRSDIFALGAVLYEMATGRRAFTGDSCASLASSILTSQPPSIAASPALDRLVRGCLEKDPDRRWQSAQDVGVQLAVLDDIPPTGESGRRPRGVWPAWTAAAVALVMAATAWWPGWRRVPEATIAGAMMKFAVHPPPQPDGFLFTAEAPTLAVSPDGTHLAFVTINRSGGTRVWVRPLAALDSRPLDGTDGARSLFWSPDSRSIGFFGGGSLKRVDLAGGAPVAICRTRDVIGQSGTWGASGTILFASVEGDAIFSVADSGGSPVALVKSDPRRDEHRVSWPVYLPDGRRFIYSVTHADDTGAIMLAEPGRTPIEVVSAKSNAAYVDGGYLLYVQESSIIARRFDASSGQLSGPPIPVADPVNYVYPTGLAHFSASRNGTIALQPHINLTRIAWFGRAGEEISTIRPAAGYMSVRASPDGRHLLYERFSRQRGAHDIYALELERGAEVQLTNAPGTEAYPQWGPDETIVYMRTTGSPPRLFQRSISSGSEQALVPQSSRGLQQPTDVSPDGAWVLYSQRSDRGDYDVHALQLADKRIMVVRDSDASETDAQFSPDGRYVAYVSAEGGRPNVFVMPFRSPGSRRAISIDGGQLPRWSRDGRQLYYVTMSPTEAHVMATPITLSPSLEIRSAERLFSLPPGQRWADFAAASNGRFLAVQHVQFAGMQPLTVIANWPASLR